MANNRMWLRHKGTGKEILLAKYYPTLGQGGWRNFHATEILDKFFEDLHIAEDQEFDPMWGPTDFELVFDVEK